MKLVKYILVNETGSKNAARAIHNSTVSDIRFHSYIVCDAISKSQVSGSKERHALIDELCRLRRQWPEAKILGISELDVSASHAPVRVSQEMNRLRRELSDLT